MRSYKRFGSQDIRQALYESVNRCSPYPKTLMSPLCSGRGLTVQFSHQKGEVDKRGVGGRHFGDET